MRFVTVPEPFELEHMKVKQKQKNEKGEDVEVETHPKVTFPEFVRKWLVSHADVTKSDDNLRFMQEIGEAVKNMKPTETLELSTEQHDFLSTIARTTSYSNEVKLAAIPHIRAITSAPNVDPRKKKLEAVGEAAA